MRLIRLLFAIGMASAGCSSEPGKSDSSPPTGAPEDTGASELEVVDEDLLRAAIAGEEDALEALSIVADRGGLPVETASGTFLFACLCGDGDWQLAGDHDGWAGEPMARAGALSWVEVAIDVPDGSRYKFRSGDTWVPDPLARRYGYDEYGELSLVRSSAEHLERGVAPAAYGLDARRLRVRVPAGGRFTHMLVAHDGQNLFDPFVWNGSWHLDDAAAGEPVLIVGIDNTSARMDEYTHTTDIIDGQTFGGRADDYAELVHDVRLQMEDRYGVAERTAVMGSSLGGLVSFAIADIQGGDWDAALSLSGTMGWGSIGADNETMLARYATAGHRSTALYLDSGGSGTCVDTDGDDLQDDAPDGSDNYCENRQFADQLAGAGYGWDVDLWHWHEPGAPHSEAAWAARVGQPLGVFMSL